MESKVLALALSVILMAIALVAGSRFLKKDTHDLSVPHRIFRFLSGLLAGFGLFMLAGTFYYTEDPQNDSAIVVTDLKEGFALSKEKNLPIFVDAWADYCIPCVTFKTSVLDTKEVKEMLRRYVFAYVDMAVEENLWVEEKYTKTQLPWMAVFPPGETEQPAWVLNDVESKEKFLARLDGYFTGTHFEAPEDHSDSGQVEIADWLASKGLLLTILLVFLGGLLASLTPCAYPTYVLTVSFFAGQAEDQVGPGRRLLTASVIVSGMILCFSAVGVAAAMGGRAAGNLMTNPWVMSALAVLFLALAASSLGALPSMAFHTVTGSLQRRQKRNLLWALVFGLAMGLVVAPCVGPILSAIVIYIASTQNVPFGAGLMATFALGMGVLLFALAAFSQTLTRYIKMGPWNKGISLFFGIVFVAFAFFYLKSVLGFERLFYWLFSF